MSVHPCPLATLLHRFARPAVAAKSEIAKGWPEPVDGISANVALSPGKLALVLLLTVPGAQARVRASAPPKRRKSASLKNARSPMVNGVLLLYEPSRMKDPFSSLPPVANETL